MTLDKIDFKPAKKRKKSKFLFYLIILIGIIFFVKFLWNKRIDPRVIKGNIKIDKAFVTCKTDSDCTQVQKGYCHCYMGGTAISINKDKKNLWLMKKTSEKTKEKCGFVPSKDISCKAVSECINNTCQLVKSSGAK